VANVISFTEIGLMT